MPDPYRGRLIGESAITHHYYLDELRRLLGEVASGTGGLVGMIAESILSCGGQIVLPPDYLRLAHAAVRDASGLCIADEVQVGFGRVGEAFWAFRGEGSVPDIVTLGKPIGNGHPMGAVVTTPEIAESFRTGMEYFNTFGGNPVSCAVALAVLDVIEQERLPEHAHEVGELLQRGLREIAERFPIVGDVRGRGLFLGFELVTDRETLAPARGASEPSGKSPSPARDPQQHRRTSAQCDQAETADGHQQQRCRVLSPHVGGGSE